VAEETVDGCDAAGAGIGSTAVGSSVCTTCATVACSAGPVIAVTRAGVGEGGRGTEDGPDIGDDGVAVVAAALAVRTRGDTGVASVVEETGAPRPTVERVLGAAVRALGATMFVRFQPRAVGCVEPFPGCGGQWGGSVTLCGSESVVFCSGSTADSRTDFVISASRARDAKTAWPEGAGSPGPAWANDLRDCSRAFIERIYPVGRLSSFKRQAVGGPTRGPISVDISKKVETYLVRNTSVFRSLKPNRNETKIY
jgi:hypothetical protein